MAGWDPRSDRGSQADHDGTFSAEASASSLVTAAPPSPKKRGWIRCGRATDGNSGQNLPSVARPRAATVFPWISQKVTILVIGDVLVQPEHVWTGRRCASVLQPRVVVPVGHRTVPGLQCRGLSTYAALSRCGCIAAKWARVHRTLAAESRGSGHWEVIRSRSARRAARMRSRTYCVLVEPRRAPAARRAARAGPADPEIAKP